MPERPLAEVMLRDVLFCHWPIEPGKLRPLVPDALSIDTFDGSAWLSAVAVKIAEARVRHVPQRPSLASVNVRTYVSHSEKSGVYFLDLEMDDRLASWFGRLGFGMPYFHADIEREYEDGAFTVKSYRNRRGRTPARFSATLIPTMDVDGGTGIESGSLDEFLTERTNYFFEAGPQLRRTIKMLNTGADSPNGGSLGMFAGAAEHDPWEIASAEGTVEAMTLFEAAEIPQPEGEPKFNYARQQLMRMAQVRELPTPTRQ